MCTFTKSIRNLSESNSRLISSFTKTLSVFSTLPSFGGKALERQKLQAKENACSVIFRFAAVADRGHCKGKHYEAFVMRDE